MQRGPQTKSLRTSGLNTFHEVTQGDNSPILSSYWLPIKSWVLEGLRGAN